MQAPTPQSTVDQARFAALEKQVELLVNQVEQFGPFTPTQIKTPYINRSHHVLLHSNNNSDSSSDSGSDSRSDNSSDTNTESPRTSSPATSAIQSERAILEIFDKPSTKLALRIVEIIQGYGQNVSLSDVPWAGKTKFLSIVEDHVIKNETIPMVLPAFPFKSPNRKDKVIGSLPDLGEELALMHLNGLCESIAEIYEPGANVLLASDGLVYNDLMMIEDSEVWDYSSAVRDIIKDKELHHISAHRIVDLLGYPLTDNLGREEYLIHAGCYRRELVAKYGVPDFNSREAIRNDKDTAMTYRGYIKFLTKDLKHSRLATDSQSKRKFKDTIEDIALKMIHRGKIFAAAINQKCEGFVRLSIHPSVGETKLTVPLIPQPNGGAIMTPWHSSVAVGIDGSFKTVHAEDVRDTHDLVLRNGRPYCFREKSDLYDFGDLKVEFEHLYPCGLIIRPGCESGIQPSLRDVNMQKVRKLAELQSPVVMRGFAETTERELFISKAYELGEVLPWTFGILQEVKDSGRTDNLGSNVVSNEAMPMHFDGVFKFVVRKDENGNPILDEQGNEVKDQKPPKFQYFTAIATAPKGSGYTLFAASRLFFQYLPAPYTVDRLEAVKWRMDNNGFWDAKMQDLDLVVRHHIHNTPCVRWHQPWDESKTKFSTCQVTIENDSQEIVELVDRLLYDRRVCLRFTWEQGDILIADNVSMMHTRTAFTGDCDRELWRIHFD